MCAGVTGSPNRPQSAAGGTGDCSGERQEAEDDGGEGEGDGSPGGRGLGAVRGGGGDVPGTTHRLPQLIPSPGEMFV